MPKFFLNGQLTNLTGWGMVLAGLAGMTFGPFLESVGVTIANPEILFGNGLGLLGLRRAVGRIGS